MKLTGNFNEDKRTLSERLGVERSFDMIRRDLTVGGGSLSFFYIDGFIKDGEMQRIMQSLLSA